MATIIFIITGLILGYLFLKHFESIDTEFFGANHPDYESFGRITVLMSTIGGAICGCAIMYNTLNGYGVWKYPTMATVTTFYAPIILFLAIALGIFQSFFKMETAGRIAGKSFFMCIACTIGFVIGGLGSIVIICLIVLYILALFIGGALKPESNVKKYNEEADDLNNELYRARYDGVSKLEGEDLERRVDNHNNSKP